MDKPEALRLADIVERNSMFNETAKEAAAELRRLYQLAMDQQGKLYALKMARSMEQKTAALKRDALLEALKMMRSKYGEYACLVCDRADAAIAKAEGEKA